MPTGRGSGYREADHDAITATGFTAFTGFHRPDHENCQDGSHLRDDLFGAATFLR